MVLLEFVHCSKWNLLSIVWSNSSENLTRIDEESRTEIYQTWLESKFCKPQNHQKDSPKMDSSIRCIFSKIEFYKSDHFVNFPPEFSSYAFQTFRALLTNHWKHIPLGTVNDFANKKIKQLAFWSSFIFEKVTKANLSSEVCRLLRLYFSKMEPTKVSCCVNGFAQNRSLFQVESSLNSLV